jgi:hypothetical protein
LKPDDTKWKVSALLFSGRQNPQWELTVSEQKNWIKLWKQATVSSTEVNYVSKLGYTGCRLQCNEHSHWQLYNGCVSFYQAEKIISKKDEERKMELFLLSTAPEEVKEILRKMKII